MSSEAGPLSTEADVERPGLVSFVLGGRTILVSPEDYELLVLDSDLYGEVYVEPEGIRDGVYERIDPRSVRPSE